mmetsp:Transcript_1852/g.3339  ORF Transcript_1852/g.3339 Transcript_1852/m.3339 type:complete len:249 (+) Transcript_1852:112-858(+)
MAHFLCLLLLLATSISLLDAFSPYSQHHVVTYGKKSFKNQIQYMSKTVDYDEKISSCKELLCKAAITKAEDPEEVLAALQDLEKLMRQKRKVEGDGVAKQVVDGLTGEWRLIFTTGTKKTQDRFKTKINYFPLKAVQAFDATKNPMPIENAIYVGDLALIKFMGTFTFDLKKSKLEFVFDKVAIFGFMINLKTDQAAKIGASTGLGSESNVKNAEKGNNAFFNWISADDDIATARGGGGGIALWQKIK